MTNEPESTCAYCERQKQERSGGPTHNGSVRCQNGSIASGGIKAHCTCDACF